MINVKDAVTIYTSLIVEDIDSKEKNNLEKELKLIAETDFFNETNKVIPVSILSEHIYNIFKDFNEFNYAFQDFQIIVSIIHNTFGDLETCKKELKLEDNELYGFLKILQFIILNNDGIEECTNDRILSNINIYLNSLLSEHIKKNPKKLEMFSSVVNNLTHLPNNNLPLLYKKFVLEYLSNSNRILNLIIDKDDDTIDLEIILQKNIENIEKISYNIKKYALNTIKDDLKKAIEEKDIDKLKSIIKQIEDDDLTVQNILNAIDNIEKEKLNEIKKQDEKKKNDLIYVKKTINFLGEELENSLLFNLAEELNTKNKKQS